VVAGLPESLREALDSALAGTPEPDLARSVSFLVDRYRSDQPAPGPILASAADIAAYAAYRMPATYAAASAALAQFAALAKDFRPRTQVDVGGGTGAAVWAAAEVWPSLQSAQVLERVPKVIELGQRLATAAPSAAVRTASWRPFILGPRPEVPQADLITMSYVLGELRAADREPVVRELAARAQAIALVEPGTPAGYGRVIAARTTLIEAGLTIIAPCPHDLECPIQAGRDWCHFATRINRTALHRRLKDGSLGHEDEKFSYLVASRARWPQARGRVLRHPRLRKGTVSMTLCAAEPGLVTESVFKRDSGRYRQARKAEWGDAWPPG
jgi:ribosomal protein RSM22 (predicted rRNA methylase)